MSSVRESIEDNVSNSASDAIPLAFEIPTIADVEDRLMVIDTQVGEVKWHILEEVFPDSCT